MARILKILKGSKKRRRSSSQAKTFSRRHPFVDNRKASATRAATFKVVDGVKLTIQQLLQTLKQFGVTSVETVGNPFDPAVHEAMLVVGTDQEKPNHVMQEFQKGYLLNNRLLRPATVSVSKPLEEDPKTK
jgi:molecular chaperone GrpE